MNLTSSAGAKQWTYDYEPYGGVRSEVKNKPQAPANLLRFAGEYRDTTTTLYHLGARQYDSGTGRFLSADPLPAAWADPYLTTYAYAQDRPGILVDPSGLASDEPPSSGFDLPHYPCNLPQVVVGFGIEAITFWHIVEAVEATAPLPLKAVAILIGATGMYFGWQIAQTPCGEDPLQP